MGMRRSRFTKRYEIRKVILGLFLCAVFAPVPSLAWASGRPTESPADDGALPPATEVGSGLVSGVDPDYLRVYDGAALSLSSRDGRRRLSVIPAGATKGTYRWVFESVNGRLEGEIYPSGLTFGEVAVAIVDGPVVRPGVYGLALTTADGVEQAKIVIPGGGCLDAGSFAPQLLDANAFLAKLRSAAGTEEGELLVDLKEFVLGVMGLSEEGLRETSIARLNDLLKGGPAMELPRGGLNASALMLWSCIGAVLNQIAAGASLVTGCGTPLCGPYYYYCCGGAVAWYASAFIGTWNACS